MFGVSKLVSRERAWVLQNAVLCLYNAVQSDFFCPTPRGFNAQMRQSGEVEIQRRELMSYKEDRVWLLRNAGSELLRSWLA
jgi:hypothetical protein